MRNATVPEGKSVMQEINLQGSKVLVTGSAPQVTQQEPRPYAPIIRADMRSARASPV